jgi:glycosyltransferase involved in cell wall biosynthesis
MGIEVIFICSGSFPTVPCPTYPEIRLAVPRMTDIAARIEDLQPHAIHVATEGPIGWLVRRYCVRHACSFTSSYHTRLPIFVAARTPFPEDWVYHVQRYFHKESAAVMVATKSMAAELATKGFARIAEYTLGVDANLFTPRKVRIFGSSSPVFLFVGRISIEKNIEAFLSLDLVGRKVVVGDGPLLPYLKRKYPDAIFPGFLVGESLAIAYASADVFVFPSRSETFGLVLLEAMASGLPIAAYPVTGPKDLVLHGTTGYLDEDLGRATHAALGLRGLHVRAHAERFSWKSAARSFVQGIRCGKVNAIEGKRSSHENLTTAPPSDPCSILT